MFGRRQPATKTVIVFPNDLVELKAVLNVIDQIIDAASEQGFTSVSVPDLAKMSAEAWSEIRDYERKKAQ